MMYKKHAQASHVQVQLLFHIDNLTLLVEDDGIGNRGHPDPNQRPGIGLKNFASRVQYPYALWQTDTTHKGTTTLIEIPYEVASRINL